MSDNTIQCTEKEVYIMMEIQQTVRRFDLDLPQAIEILEKVTQMWKEELKQIQEQN